MTNSLIARIRAGQIRAAEDEVIASIPRELIEMMDEAQRKHEAQGGCPGCGHMVQACHYGGCPTTKDDLY